MKEKKLQPLQERFKNITNHTTELQERLKEEVCKKYFILKNFKT